MLTMRPFGVAGVAFTIGGRENRAVLIDPMPNAECPNLNQ
jgi:hypothetical protein